MVHLWYCCFFEATWSSCWSGTASCLTCNSHAGFPFGTCFLARKIRLEIYYRDMSTLFYVYLIYLFTMYVLTVLFLYWLGRFCLLILTAGLILFDSYTVKCKLNRIHSYQCFSWWGLFAVHFLRNRICTGLSLGGLSRMVTHLHSPPKCHGDEHPSTEPDVRVHRSFST